ncbi:hypothetical protein FNU76_07775 [Chitinimonas arctica]|uniref:FAD-dependent oxidoreductase n=1 Tax=Chitinimonas arctica TaxID=2594795 RepID=A0A516SDP0_9NEIS|nr:hypothetical protein [Chitinimonas arctica]QDQ26266.1 hypothetical protein FNU76_07775 [Chitinimonas arctica]
MADAVLLGNNLAMLVAAGELARRGRAVTLLTDGKGMGGIFAGLRLAEHSFDMGMVLLEKHTPAQPSQDPRDYRATVRNDCARFGSLVSRYMESHLSLVETPTPEALLDGRRWPDYLIANRLEAFAVAGQANGTPAAHMGRDEPLHAANKVGGSAFDHASYAEAAAINHGEALHRHYFEPFIRKLLGVGSEAILARFHRVGWAPLYYPETLLAACEGRHTGLPEYRLWTTSAGFVGQLVGDLLAELAQSPHVTLVKAPIESLRHEADGWHIATADGQWQAARLALGLPNERVHQLLGLPPITPPDSASIGLLFCLVRADAIAHATGCLMVVDEVFASYRLCDQDALAGLSPDWHRVVIEANSEHIAMRYPEEAAEAVMLREVCDLLGIDDRDAVQSVKYINARNALVLPTPGNLTHAAESSGLLHSATPHTRLSGNLLGYGVASINDQIVQGLGIVEEFV